MASANILAAISSVSNSRWPKRPTVDGDAYVAITERKFRRPEFL